MKLGRIKRFPIQEKAGRLKTIRFDSHVKEVFEQRIYRPARLVILRTSRRMRGLQAGSIHAYLLYIFVTLLALLMFAT